MTTIVYILVAILIFGILIAVHELGHFLAAKACGVTVNEFSIGMGPALWKKQKGETLYAPAGHPLRRLLCHGGGGRGLRRSPRPVPAGLLGQAGDLRRRGLHELQSRDC